MEPTNSLLDLVTEPGNRLTDYCETLRKTA